MSEAISTSELSQFVPLNALSPENLKELAKKARRVSVPHGRYLFRNGERPANQLFLLEGSVELVGDDGVERVIEARMDEASNSLDGAGPQARAARAKTDVKALAVDRDMLDLMLTWDQTGSYNVEDLAETEAQESEDDWMTRLLQTDCFRRIPPANIQAIFQRMEPVHVNPGDVVIRQGEPGEYFYIIRDGRCLVTRATKAKPKGVRLAELGPGDSFGEEALISDKERNATVTMVSRGTLMRMSKSDFKSLLNEPLQQYIDYGEAAELAQSGAHWIDVRLPGEFEDGHIAGAANIPLFFLRMKAQKLDPNVTYIIYCDTGRRSSAGAFLLSERGFDARILRDGLAKAPSEAIEQGQSQSAP
jgi:CRP-like cAMP-binding protein